MSDENGKTILGQGPYVSKVHVRHGYTSTHDMISVYGYEAEGSALVHPLLGQLAVPSLIAVPLARFLACEFTRDQIDKMETTIVAIADVYHMAPEGRTRAEIRAQDQAYETAVAIGWQPPTRRKE